MPTKLADEPHITGIAAVRETMTRAGFLPIAEVLERADTMDMAFRSPAGAQVVLRYRSRPRPADHSALARMLADGDFDEAVLVCSQIETGPDGPIRVCNIADIRALAASLASSGHDS